MIIVDYNFLNGTGFFLSTDATQMMKSFTRLFSPNDIANPYVLLLIYGWVQTCIMQLFLPEYRGIGTEGMILFLVVVAVVN